MGRPDSPNKHELGFSDLNLLYSFFIQHINYNFSLFR